MVWGGGMVRMKELIERAFLSIFGPVTGVWEDLKLYNTWMIYPGCVYHAATEI
jgi:hypothetical protein